VIASDPRFTGVQALNPGMIGASAWYDVQASEDGYRVAITVGWGDCMAGCISRHIWVFDVAADGTIALAEESGEPFQGGVLMPPVVGDAPVDVEIVAGPGCAVDPGCPGAPAQGATVIFLDPFGTEVSRLAADATGHAKGTVPSGTYVLVVEPKGAGQTGPEPIAASIVAAQTAYIRLAIDDPAG
jgi:hypothetical protein